MELLAMGGVREGENPGKGDALTFKLYRGYTVVVRGSIGGLEKLRFLIDTGAVPSIVDRRIAHKLRLVGAKERVYVYNQNLETQGVVVPSVELGPIRTESLHVLVDDLSFVERGLGVRVDAIIGLDVLGSSDFCINYEAKKISFGRSGDPSPSPELVVPFQTGPGSVFVKMEVQGQPLRLMVDTGAKNLMLFGNRVRGRLAALPVLGQETTATLGGAFRTRRVQLAEARLGRREMGNLTAYFMDILSDARVDFDGLLGISSLGFTRIAFDFKHQTIGLGK
jgi:predicted aspartyl protease